MIDLFGIKKRRRKREFQEWFERQMKSPQREIENQRCRDLQEELFGAKTLGELNKAWAKTGTWRGFILRGDHEKPYKREVKQ